jgi:anti-anti-sigma factor
MNRETPPFSATVAHVDGSAVVTLVGELDVESATELAESGPAEVVVDCSHLDFIDSSGLAVLITAQERLRMRARNLSVRSPNPVVARVFAVTNLSEYFGVEPSATVEPRPVNGE